MKEILIGMLIRFAGKLLLQLFTEAVPIFQRIQEDPDLITDTEKREALLMELKDKFPNDQKMLDKLFPLIDDMVTEVAKNYLEK